LRPLTILILAILLLRTTSGFAYDLLVLQSQRSPVYDEVMRGVRSVAKYSQRVIVLNDYNEVDLQRIVREEKPLVILTLGDNALAEAQKIKELPIVSLMALSYRAGMGGHPALTGVEILLHPERYLTILNAMKVTRVGIVANTTRNANYLKIAQKAASRHGIDIVLRDVKSPKDVAAQLQSLSGSVDSLWMLPDNSVATGENADSFFLFAASRRLPVITFSANYLAFGSAVALEIDRYDLGKQGGEMVSQLLSGHTINDVAPALPRKNQIKLNPVVLRRLGISSELPVFNGGN